MAEEPSSFDCAELSGAHIAPFPASGLWGGCWVVPSDIQVDPLQPRERQHFESGKPRRRVRHAKA